LLSISRDIDLMEIDECGFILMEAESKFGTKADELDSECRASVTGPALW
jgi:hypothetical protein